jgi:[protein-PII] uridylyltransferase
VSDDAINCVQQHAARFTAEDFFPTRAHRAAFLRFLKPRPGLYARLSEMHDTGLLGQMVPEFKAISFLVVRDFYHKYTVDEHTLLTIRTLERLAGLPGASKETSGESRQRERFADLLNDLEAPELLVLALLLHDVGKSGGQNHALESVRMGHELFDRLGLDEAKRAVLEFLITNHLKMSLVAFRRDTEDPEVVRQFSELVGVEERLKMLCLMTLADLEAVSQETLTGWKEELLWRLYVDTYNHLTLEYGDQIIDSKQDALADLTSRRPPDLTEKEVSEFLQGLPRRYLQLFSHDKVYRHVRLALDLAPDAVQAWLERTDSAWELTVLARDRSFLFSNICGVLSSYGMDILRGVAFTKPDGLIVDMFHFHDEEKFLELNEGGDRQLLKTLDDVLHGRSDVAARLKGREEGAFKRKLPAFRPVVHVDNESSRRYTIVEVVAEDALGLLYRMSRTMSESGCDVDLVLISTEGRRAFDVFHLTRSGAKLTSAQQLDLTNNLQRVLEGRSHEADQVDHSAEQSR